MAAKRKVSLSHYDDDIQALKEQIKQKEEARKLARKEILAEIGLACFTQAKLTNPSLTEDDYLNQVEKQLKEKKQQVKHQEHSQNANQNHN